MMLTYAYAGIIFDDEHYKNLAKKLYKSLSTMIQNIRDMDGLTTGAFHGTGSLIYSIYCLYILWGQKNKELLNNIEILIDICTKILKKDPHNFDVMTGSSGFLAILNMCSNILTQEKFETLSDLCINNLLNSYPEPSILTDHYPIPAIRPLLGFSHGVSGVAWALLPYYRRTLDSRAGIWIQKALDYERAYYSPVHNNWPDFRGHHKTSDEHSNKCMSAWCHGAIGIGLSRLDMKRQGWFDGIIDQEIRSSINIAKIGFDEVLNLCHGSLGRLELLQVAADQQYISESDLFNYIGKVAVYIKESNALSYEKVGNIFVPGLFTGACGLAFQFLRLVYPKVIPSLLLLQTPTSVLIRGHKHKRQSAATAW